MQVTGRTRKESQNLKSGGAQLPSQREDQVGKVRSTSTDEREPARRRKPHSHEQPAIGGEATGAIAGAEQGRIGRFDRILAVASP